jgi:hypothetical protein
MRKFHRQFATEEACQDYLAACRWPDGFVCPRCGHRRGYRITTTDHGNVRRAGAKPR